jgi:hypothetical protein
LPAIAVVAALMLFGAGNGIQSAHADAVDAYIDDPLGGCNGLDQFENVDNLTGDNVLAAHTGDIIPICANFDTADEANFQSSAGKFVDSVLCGVTGDPIGSYTECLAYTGLNTPDVNINEPSWADTEGGADCTDDCSAVVFFQCPAKAAFVTIDITQGMDELTYIHGTIRCYGEPDSVTVTAKPTKVEIVPAVGSVAHSEISIVASSNSLPIDPLDTEIDVSVPKCAIEAGLDDPDTTPLADSTFDKDEGYDWTLGTLADWNDIYYGDRGDVARSYENALHTQTTVDNIWFHADWNACTPGDVVVTVTVEVDNGPDITKTVTINVVGPAAFITATASPSSVVCGEKSTITVKVTDSIGQNVSDNTQVELITNWGGVIGGTGATLGFPGTGPVNPLASSAAATYNGVAIAYLITSDTHVGSYEVVAAAGGTTGLYNVAPNATYNDTYYPYSGEYYNDNDPYTRHSDPNGGNTLLYTGAPVTSQVTVTCSMPAAAAPSVTAPNTGTGTGSITPPNTGDAGLASSSQGSSMYLVIAGAVAFVLAGIASVSYARR